MKIPYDWLADFVDLSGLSVHELAETISLKAFEVEEVESVGALIEGPLVSGKIVEIQKHPNADKLQVTKTQVDPQAPPRQIVCGAKNISVGQMVPVALPGAVVLNRNTGKPLPIKLGTIRNIESQGMLCSASELGINSDVEGIHILSSDLPVGLDLLHELNLKPKHVLHVASRSNRGDAMSLLGIARETAATLNRKLKQDHYKTDHAKRFTSLTNSLSKFSASIHAPKACCKVGFLYISGLTVSESPDWMKERLKLAGIGSINNVVDIGNYVMLELGQPMHAYDASKVNWQDGLSVALNGQDGIKFETLDGKECKLQRDHLIIQDSKEVLALAGVMGGQTSAVSQSTQSIILEAACFAPLWVRRTSRQTGISTESSRRFERGTDPNLVDMALLRAAELLEELAGGKVEAFSLQVTDETGETHNVQLDLRDYERLMGDKIDAIQASEILEQLGFLVRKINPELIDVRIPSFREGDVQRSVDLIEELARFRGLNEIESCPLPGVQKLLPVDKQIVRLKDKLIAFGYFENISSSLLPEGVNQCNSVLLGSTAMAVKMNNPLSREHAELRQTLLPGLLKAVALNYKRQRSSIKLFEIGKIYAFKEQWLPQVAGDKRQTQAEEKLVLSLLCSSRNKSLNWQALQSTTDDFYELKGILESLTEGKGRLELITQSLNSDLLHPSIAATVRFNGQLIGYCAKLHPLLCRTNEVSENTFALEILAEPLLRENRLKFKPLNDTPLLSRDFTVDLPVHTQLTHEKIEKKVSATKLSGLKDFKLLNRYQGKNSDSFSLSYRLVFQGDKQNLLGEEINAEMDRLKKALQEQFSEISFREG